MMDLRTHLESRFVDLAKHKVWLDYVEGVATFPLTNLSGQLVGYQQYRPSANKEKKNHPKDGRYFTYTKKESRGVWVLNRGNFPMFYT